MEASGDEYKQRALDNREYLLKMAAMHLDEDISELVKKAEFEGDAKYLQEQQANEQRRMEYNAKKLGDCIWCGGAIHNKPAKEEADLLAKYTGIPTGILCCSCFNKLRNYEEVKKKVETST
jgi:hypothetical protein